MTETKLTTLVRCPRCGSTKAESAESFGLGMERMLCSECQYSETCDDYGVKFDWNERFALHEGQEVPAHVLPTPRFFACLEALGAPEASPERPESFDLMKRIRAGYSESHRAYHTADHVCACLKLFDTPEVAALATSRAEVECALWLHDWVYDTQAQDNEEQSASLAKSGLLAAGVSEAVAERVAQHILATKSHLAANADSQLVVDIDLAILGAPPALYARFEEWIRAEYSWVPEEHYRAGRRAVLERFLERPSIYSHKLFQSQRESQARSNIKQALATLCS
jgi:predicted metal-dependent HD superfamily phosphohydrolase